MEALSVRNPALVVCPHPILAAAGRELHYAEFLPGESIAAYLDRAGIKLGRQPWVLAVDGQPVPREWWGRVRPKPGTLITLRAMVHGGGGGGGKNPLSTVLSIALMVVAPYAAGALYTAMGGTLVMANAAFMLGAIQVGISVAGNLLIGALTQAPQPELSQVNGAFNAEQVSPTYALAGGSNRARPFEPLPLLLGRHRIFPDYGAKAYTEFEGDDQYLYQIFNFGIGTTDDLLLTDYKIGSTPITSYSDVEIFEAGADGKLPQMPGNVDTTAGGALTSAGGWITRTSGANSTALAVDIQGALLRAGDAGLETLTVKLQAEYRAVGSADWLPFMIGTETRYYTHYWSAGRNLYDAEGSWMGWVQVDYGSTDPAQHVEGEVYDASNTWRWRAYADVPGFFIGQPAGGDPRPEQSYQVETAYVTLSSASRKPIRRTWRKAVSAGQYEVRMLRVTADETDSRNTSEFSWNALKSYQPDTADYTGQRRVGVRIKASGQLQGQIEQFNAIGSRKALAWNGAEWVLQETSNPAWLTLWFARGRTINGRPAFGVCLDDARIDIDGLKSWGAFCTAKGLSFNAVFDAPRSRADMLNTIALCGRGSPSWATGKLGAVWDAPDLPAVAVFGMSNIVAGSFKVQYANEKLADEIVLNFINPDNDWQQDQVRVVVPGFPEGYVPQRPAVVELFGCADKTMAGKEANLLAAHQRYHRRRVQWESDFEGLVAQRGDVVTLSHDLTQWGTSGRLVGATDTTVTLDRKVSYNSGSPYIGVRHPDGTYHLRAVQAFAGESDTLTLLAALTFTEDAITYNPGTDPNGPVVDYIYVFEPLATPGKRVKIVGVPSIRNAGARLQFSATDDAAGYYASESNPYTWVPRTAVVSLPGVANLRVTEELIRAGNGFAVRLYLTWDVLRNGYDHAVVKIGASAADLAVSGTSVGSRYEVIVPDAGQALMLSVQAFNGLGQSDPVNGVTTTTYTVIGKTAKPANVSSLSISGAILSWPAVADIDVAGYQIRFHYGNNLDWGSATPLHAGLLTSSPFDLVARPAGVVTLMIKAIDTSGNESAASANVVTNLGDAPIANVVETIALDPAFSGTITGGSVVGGALVATALDSFYGTDDQSFYGDDTAPFYEESGYAEMTYVSGEIVIGSALAGSLATLAITAQGAGLKVDYRFAAPESFYGADDDSFFGPDDEPFYGAASEWQPLPGQISVINDVYQVRVQTAAGTTQGEVSALALVIDAPDMEEDIDDLVISAAGTVIPYTKPFTVIKGVRAQLQANASGAETIEIDKSNPLAPSAKAYNSAHVAVSGASADVNIKGY